jgi:hypothetical protein
MPEYSRSWVRVPTRSLNFFQLVSFFLVTQWPCSSRSLSRTESTLTEAIYWPTVPVLNDVDDDDDDDDDNDLETIVGMSEWHGNHNNWRRPAPELRYPPETQEDSVLRPYVVSLYGQANQDAFDVATASQQLHANG